VGHVGHGPGGLRQEGGHDLPWPRPRCRTTSIPRKPTQQIDKEIKKIIDQAYANSKHIILENRGKLEIIAQQLLEKESLTSDDIAAILGTPKKPDPLQAKKRKPRNGAAAASAK